MPQDLDSLAAKFGGVRSSPSSSIPGGDLDALATKFGGVRSPSSSPGDQRTQAKQRISSQLAEADQLANSGKLKDPNRGSVGTFASSLLDFVPSLIEGASDLVRPGRIRRDESGNFSTGLERTASRIQGMGEGMANEAGKSIESFKSGRPLSALEGVGHGVAAALPGLGPAAVSAGEEIGSGEYAKGLGHATGLIAAGMPKTIGSKVGKMIPTRKPPAPPAPPAPSPGSPGAAASPSRFDSLIQKGVDFATPSVFKKFKSLVEFVDEFRKLVSGSGQVDLPPAPPTPPAPPAPPVSPVAETMRGYRNGAPEMRPVPLRPPLKVQEATPPPPSPPVIKPKLVVMEKKSLPPTPTEVPVPSPAPSPSIVERVLPMATPSADPLGGLSRDIVSTLQDAKQFMTEFPNADINGLEFRQWRAQRQGQGQAAGQAVAPEAPTAPPSPPTPPLVKQPVVQAGASPAAYQSWRGKPVDLGESIPLPPVLPPVPSTSPSPSGAKPSPSAKSAKPAKSAPPLPKMEPSIANQAPKPPAKPATLSTASSVSPEGNSPYETKAHGVRRAGTRPPPSGPPKPPKPTPTGEPPKASKDYESEARGIKVRKMQDILKSWGADADMVSQFSDDQWRQLEALAKTQGASISKEALSKTKPTSPETRAQLLKALRGE